MNLHEIDDGGAVRKAEVIVDGYWHDVQSRFLVRLERGEDVAEFPRFNEEAAEQRSTSAEERLAALDSIELSALPDDTRTLVDTLRFQLGVEAQALDRFWLAETYAYTAGTFATTPYAGGHLFNAAKRAFKDFVFHGPSDSDKYLGLVVDYGRMLEDLRSKVLGQSQRGILIPRPALKGVRRYLESLAQSAAADVSVDESRLREISRHADFKAKIDHLSRTVLEPGFARFRADLGAGYEAAASEGVGMAQYPRGSDIYGELVAEQTSLPLSIEAIHSLGLESLGEIEDAMRQIRQRSGIPDRVAFERHVASLPGLTARTPGEIREVFTRSLGRIEPELALYFSELPVTPYSVERLGPELEAGMTNGYYQEPTVSHPGGVYYYNGGAEQSASRLPSLVFHELVPGHHLHFASQYENRSIHPVTRHLFFNAFNEGWAEYAATIAGEMGMYDDDHLQYGRLQMDAYVAARLVVDTGLNALRWSLDRARGFLREKTHLGEKEIASETLRYSTDIPAQGLAYKVGQLKFVELRDRAHGQLGGRFSHSEFHRVALGAGAIPLSVLEARVDRWIDREKRGGA